MEDALAGLAMGAAIYIAIAYSLFLLIATWVIYVKAGEPGWAMLIPIYNLIVLHRMAGKPGWWVLLYFIPVVSLIIVILVYIGLAERFGQGAGFGLGLAFLAPIFFPILAYSDIEYEG